MENAKKKILVKKRTVLVRKLIKGVNRIYKTENVNGERINSVRIC